MALDTPFFGPDLLFNIFEKLNFGILRGLVICELCKDHKTDCELKYPSDSCLVKSNLDNPTCPILFTLYST